MMHRLPLIAALLVYLLLVTSTGCKGEPEVFTLAPDPMDQWFDATLSAEGTLRFSVLPISESHLQKVYPLGTMGSHTFPTDHIYLEHASTTDAADISAQVTIHAPAAGRILHIVQGKPPYHDDRVHISISRDITYVLDHVLLDAGIEAGDQVATGERLGICVQGSNLDLLVLDRRDGKNACDNSKYPITAP